MAIDDTTRPLSESTAELLAQYQLVVEMADRVSARRATANAFFATVNAAYLGILGGYLLPQAWQAQLETRPWGTSGGAALACLVGLLLSLTWYLLLKSYRDLNAAKYAVICEMEKTLASKPFTDEWRLLTLEREVTRRFVGRYAELGLVERCVPGVFFVAYAGALGMLIADGFTR